MSEETEMVTFDDVLNGQTAEPKTDTPTQEASPNQETEPAKIEETTQAAATEETNVPTEAVNTQAQASAPATQEEKVVPLAALQSERQKRQELQRQLEQYQAQSQSVQQTQVPSYFEDPEQHLQAKVGQVQNEFNDRFVVMSEQVSRMSHPDYEEKFQAFKEAAQVDPKLVQQVLQSTAPGEMAYQLGDRFLFEKNYGSNPTQIKAKMRAELESEIKKEVSKQFSQNLRAASNQPTNILAARTANGSAQTEWKPTTFAEVLKR